MTTALYRRYRPDSFEDVIGQEHVTRALENALSSSRVAHAFLFSGPRGCGKTTSARILARSLNCAEGPTPTPCGNCPSCRDLASGGPGSLDVVEIDAASHNGVDDARDLRERAGFAPSRDRYRIYILDEAHMVTAQGFNALLKVVEEPPEHVKFIFATTEPEKVLTTIRSRTHHYPFRLVAPAVLVPYLKSICAREGVDVDDSVLPLVVRAGGGSVRDSLSVLDQLIAGADGVVTHESAVRLLGYTDTTLLEQAVDALGSEDGAAVFDVVEQIIGAGHEPRRFVEDLLQWLRDLMVCALAGDKAADILIEVPPERLARMRDQAAQWGTRLLSRRADMVEGALREMVGATAPRLQLELLLARLLVSAGPIEGAHPEVAEPTSSPGPKQHHVRQPDKSPAGHSPLSVPAASEKHTPEGAPQPAAAPVLESSTPESTHSIAVAPDWGESAAEEPPADSTDEGPVESVEALDDITAPGALQAEVSSEPHELTKEELRNRWRDIQADLKERAPEVFSALRTINGVDIDGETVTWTIRDADALEEFSRLDGQRHLSAVLSEVFGAQLVGTIRGSEPAPPAPESMEPEDDSEPEGSNESDLAPPVEDQQHVGAAVWQEPSVPSDPERELQEPNLDSTTSTRSEQELPADVHSKATTDLSGELARDPDSIYRSMQAEDVVLDLLGGQVVERFDEEQSPE